MNDDVRTCEEVSDYECKAPAGYRVGSGIARGLVACRGECYVCGKAVCSSPGCSKIKTVEKGKRARVCASCIEEREGE